MQLTQVMSIAYYSPQPVLLYAGCERPMLTRLPEDVRRHFVFEALQVSALIVAMWWWCNLPVPGYSVAVIAALAAAMSIHGEMKPWHKAIWMLLIGAFLILEFRAINKDRREYSQTESAKRIEESAAFQSIASGIDKTISSSDKHFNATMGKTTDVLSNITGGKSYAVVLPMLGSYRPDRPVPLAIENHGLNILTGVSVTIYESGIWIEATHESMLQSIANRINVGTLHPGERLVLGAQLRPEGLMSLEPDMPNAHRGFIYITAQNFSSEEYLDFQPKPSGGWRFRYFIERQLFNSKSGKKSPQTRPTLPQLLEQVDWSDDANNLNFKQP
jgi:hypothetical protein